MNLISRRKFLITSTTAGAALLAGTVLCPLNSGVAAPADESFLGLALPPFLGKPHTTAISVNLVAGKKTLNGCLEYRQSSEEGEREWKCSSEMVISPFTPREITLDDLVPGTRYDYRFRSLNEDGSIDKLHWKTHFSTPSLESPAFSFALFSDAHITPFHPERQNLLMAVSNSIRARQPAFGMMLGDNIQTISSHGGPMTEEQHGPLLYANLRLGLGALPAEVPIFNLIGNWEGENGWHSKPERQLARRSRLAFIPTPDNNTYHESGGSSGDYYGFTRGDVLFLALNVTGYTKKDHSLGSPIGRPDDWTLGEAQKTWLYEQLSRSRARWKLIFAHHTVGGNAGDTLNSRYGRGGGRAAKTGEQALIHSWMREFGVQALFYGHDHVFTNIPVDGIHYICVGSAGAPWKFDQTVTGYQASVADSGYTWVDVEPRRLKIDFVTPDTGSPRGKTLHTLEIPAPKP